MKIETSHASWEFKRASETIRVNRRFDFESPEASERFAERAGIAISFPNLAVYVDPITGSPQASISIECRDDSQSLANAYLLLDSFEGLHAAHA